MDSGSDPEEHIRARTYVTDDCEEIRGLLEKGARLWVLCMQADRKHSQRFTFLHVHTYMCNTCMGIYICMDVCVCVFISSEDPSQMNRIHPQY